MSKSMRKIIKEFINLFETASAQEIADLEHQIRLNTFNPNIASLWRVYADHLLDQGDIRGELIHTDLDLANHTLSGEELKELDKKRVNLAKQLAILDPEVSHNHASFRSRAMISPFAHERMHFDYPRHAKFDVNDVLPEDIKKTLTHKASKFLSYIEFSTQNRTSELSDHSMISEILSMPEMRKIYHLKFLTTYENRNDISVLNDKICEGIAESHSLTNIRVLMLQDCKLTSDNVITLSYANLPNLQKLFLMSNRLDKNALMVLSEKSPFPALKILNISSNRHISVEDFVNFMRTDFAKSLTAVISEHATEEVKRQFPNAHRNYRAAGFHTLS